MNYLKSTFLVFFFLISQALADVKIIEWKEEAKLTDYGRRSKFLIKIQAVNLPKDYVVSSFSITNSSAQKKLITSMVRVDYRSAQSLSIPGSFEIFFNKPLANNQYFNRF